ncbi:uncharacterized protein LOC134291919 [Aedes albopictus]|uniref:Integrase catalytic domain-containing protein n=1 Tax=Aedes albopictus TaxID=7160 RepID=A0ABM1XWX8_AEDAL
MPPTKRRKRTYSAMEESQQASGVNPPGHNQNGHHHQNAQQQQHPSLPHQLPPQQSLLQPPQQQPPPNLNQPQLGSTNDALILQNLQYLQHQQAVTNQRIHVDYAGPLQGEYLVTVDAYSKWPEIFPTKSITSKATINLLRSLFANKGMPEVLVSDNGTQFTSAEFKEFCNENGVEHVTTAPFCSIGDGIKHNQFVVQ